MSNWQTILKESPVDWLLEESNPSVRYFTLHDIFGKSEDDTQVAAAKRAIPESKVVNKIFQKQNAKGYWEEPFNPYHPKYKSSYWQIMTLAQLGMNKTDERVERACEYIFQFQQKDGGFSSFTFDNQTTLELAKHLLRHRTGSQATLYQYVYGVHRFCKWLNTQPDLLVKSCQDQDGDPKPKALAQTSRMLDDFVANLQAENLAPGSISNHVKGVKALFRCNRLKLDLPYSLSKRGVYEDRAPTLEELQKLLDIANLREQVIIIMLALGGFRIGTLVKLCYRHVKRDLERQVIPIHVHVEAEITKGKYHDYDTFLNQEAAEYLRDYIEIRRQGTRRIPPENIHDDSPLIRDGQCKHPKPVTEGSIHRTIHRIYIKAGLLTKNPRGRRYDLRAHSIRKFFRTQLASLSVQADYIEYMMGHTISTYHDIKMKGTEYLRGIYIAASLSIKPKTRLSKIDVLKEIIRAWGLNPEEILTRDALTRPNRTIIDNSQLENHQLTQLTTALKQQMLKEIQENQPLKV